MRIGTWNLAGRWTPGHERFLLALDCDVLLLTEVSERLDVPELHLHLGEQLMAARRRWAGILSREPIAPLPDPHAASAVAVVSDVTFCSSILPWKSAGSRDPWIGSRHVDKTEACVTELLAKLPTDRLIWGGDWNHALSGREWAGSIGGRLAVLAAVEKLDLKVPTAALPHAIDGLLAIDHIAVPVGTDVRGTHAFSASHDSRRLSDHDAYVIEIAAI